MCGRPLIRLVSAPRLESNGGKHGLRSAASSHGTRVVKEEMPLTIAACQLIEAPVKAPGD